MPKLIYSQLCSLDGYIADEAGNFRWAAPDAEVHAFVNDRERLIGTALIGRGMFEVLSVWDTWDVSEEPAEIQEYQQIWKAAEKIVYSRTLTEVTTTNTRLVPEFDAEAVRAMKAEATSNLSIGGPNLASAALAAGLVDEVHLIMAPVVIGAGKAVFPDGLRLDLELIDEQRFAGGFVHVGYSVRG